MPANVNVKMNAEQSYSIKIRRGIIERLGIEILRLCDDSYAEILIITDEKVSGLYLQQVIMNFQECPKPKGMRLRICEILIDSREASKNFQTVAKLLDDMAALGLSGKCIVVALGGGVVCDAAGFAAGCYMGGVRLVLVPTTLSAMIEVSAWGNALLNLSAGKNLAGMSCRPSVVICDTDCLKTLSHEEYKSGIAETLKTAIMSGEELFRIFERGDVQNNIERVIEGCIKYRANLKSELRTKCLGYSLGNAIESLSGYEIQHGFALSQGIAITAGISAEMGWCSKETASRIINALSKNELPVTCRKYSAHLISQTLLQGRKISDGILELVAISEIGECCIMNIKASELEDIISSGINA